MDALEAKATSKARKLDRQIRDLQRRRRMTDNEAARAAFASAIADLEEEGDADAEWLINQRISMRRRADFAEEALWQNTDVLIEVETTRVIHWRDGRPAAERALSPRWQAGRFYAPKIASEYAEPEEADVVLAKVSAALRANAQRQSENRQANEVPPPAGGLEDLPKASPFLRKLASSAMAPVSQERLAELIADNRITFGDSGSNRPCLKRFLIEMEGKGLTAKTVWHYNEVGENRHASNEAKQFNERDPFGTPKPESLLYRIMQLSTESGDLVLDSFAGSGTTGAVAHKMGRRWIMVEIGDHADTHIVPRLKKVIDGSDQGGISKAVDWKGGGGFRYFTLAPSLLTQDKYGNWVIAQDYNPAMLAEAMCKHMGFTYAPSAEDYWRHGASTETDFIYVTTQNLTHEACAKIAQDVGPDRSLLICCKAYSAEAEAFENLTLVKIPTSILQKCEWGRDDYSLNIANLPLMENDGAPTADALPLFGGEAGDE